MAVASPAQYCYLLFAVSTHDGYREHLQAVALSEEGCRRAAHRLHGRELSWEPAPATLPPLRPQGDLLFSAPLQGEEEDGGERAFLLRRPLEA